MRTEFLLLAGILLLALALRLAPWGDNRFLEDEALYAYWGLQIATGTDPMLDREPVDKPPLHPYVLALSYTLSGLHISRPGPHVGDMARWESAARLPSLMASVVGVALVYALAQQLYGDTATGLLAALLLALSPFDILFASTAFTDPLMAALALGALWAGAGGRLGVAGLLAGLSAATKQQALLFLPLVVALALISTYRRSARPERSAWLRFAVGFGAVAAAVFWWDGLRVQRPGFWSQSLLSYGGLGWARLDLLEERAAGWLRLAGDFWASPWANGLFVLAVLVWPVMIRRRCTLGAGSRATPPTSESCLQQAAWSAADAALFVFVAAFLAVHWLIGFQVWDRYVLGLVPLVALLVARALLGVGRAIRAVPWQSAYVAAVGLALLVFLTRPVALAGQSRLPVGGDHGAYDGIDRLADAVRATAPPGSVLYHHWLGYHYRFYLYGAPLRLHWYPDAQDLVEDATLYRREPRYIAFPSFRDSTPMRLALEASGIVLVPVYETTRRDGTVSFRLYRLEGPNGDAQNNANG